MANFSNYVAEALAAYYKTGSFGNIFPHTDNQDTVGSIEFEVALYNGNSGTPDMLANNDHSHEVGGIGYTRVPVQFKDPVSYVGEGIYGQAALINDGDVIFPTPGGSWGTVTHFAVIANWSSSSQGSQSQVFMWGHLNVPQVVGTGSPVNFPEGAIKITFR